MIEKISHKLAVLAIEKEEISRENYDIYKYGLNKIATRWPAEAVA